MSTLENTANTTQWTAPARHLLCSVSDEMTMRIFFKAGGTAEQKRGERGRVCGVDVRLAGTPRFLSPLAMGRRTSERTDGRTNGRMTTTVVGGRQARVRGMIGAQAARACRARDRCELGLVSGPRGCYPLARSLAVTNRRAAPARPQEKVKRFGMAVVRTVGRQVICLGTNGR